MKKICLILTLMLFSIYEISLAQNIIKISNDFSSQSLQKEEVLFLQDKTGSLSIEDITQTKYQKQFKVIPKNSPTFGYSNEVFWLKIQLQKSKSNLQNNYVLEVNYPLLDTVNYYYRDKTKHWKVETLGDRFPFSQRKFKHRNFIFSLDFYDNQTQTVYIRVHSKGSIIIPLNIYSIPSLRETQATQEVFYGIYYGVLGIMAFYNLFLFFSLKDRNYLLYFICIITNVMVQANLVGHSVQYLWGDAIYWANISVLFFLCMGFASNIIFSVNFIKVKKYQSRLYYVMLFFGALTTTLAFLVFFIDYTSATKLIALMGLSSTLTILVAGFWTWAKGNPYARLFVFAWIFYLAGVLIQVFKFSGFLPDIFIVRHSVHIGSMLEVLFLSFALADRINTYRKNTAEAQRIALEKSQENQQLIEEQKETLEQKVQERTYELHEANQELVVQEEELRQNMEELQTIQDALESQSRQLEIQNRKTQNSIKSAKAIQQAILPYQAKLDKLLKDYFVIYRPKDVVSGDFYWLNKIENKTVLAVVDCTGHGVPGAFMSLIGNTLLDKIVRVWNIANPAEILSKLNEDIQVMLRQKETNNNNGMDMTIMNWEYLDNEKVKLEFAGAKNSFLYIEPNSNEMKEVKGDRKSIGGLQKSFQVFTFHELFLEKNTSIYLGSDGLEDQNNFKRKKFGRKKFIQLLCKNVQKPLAKQQEIIETALEAHMQGTTQRDDILWIGLKL